MQIDDIKSEGQLVINDYNWRPASYMEVRLYSNIAQIKDSIQREANTASALTSVSFHV